MKLNFCKWDWILMKFLHTQNNLGNGKHNKRKKAWDIFTVDIFQPIRLTNTQSNNNLNKHKEIIERISM